MIAVVSAEEITILEEKFNIPDGFEENESGTEPENIGAGVTLYKTFVKGNDSFTIKVYENKNGWSTVYEASDGEVEKTINGYSGIYNEKTHTFSYHGDTGEVRIKVSDIKLLNEIIIKK